MMLSTKGRYAVMAMVDLASQPVGKPVGLAAIAERQEIPLAYLEQIFSRLKRSDLITSVRGPGGGYQLARAAEEMPVSEIMSASEEPLKMTRCDGHTPKGCLTNKTRCLTHDLWQGLSDQIQHYLENITLADVVQRKVDPSLRAQRSNPSSEVEARWIAASPTAPRNDDVRRAGTSS